MSPDRGKQKAPFVMFVSALSQKSECQTYLCKLIDRIDSLEHIAATVWNGESIESDSWNHDGQPE